MAEADTSTRMKASDFHPYILEIFDGYVHGKLTKREFIREAGKFAAAGVTGLMILNQLQPDYALAQQVKADDPAIVTSRVTVQSPDGHGSISGLLARPRAASPPPAMLAWAIACGLSGFSVVRALTKISSSGASSNTRLKVCGSARRRLSSAACNTSEAASAVCRGFKRRSFTAPAGRSALG